MPGHLKYRDRQKSWRDTCDSNKSASAQSNRLKVKASRGWCAVAGHNSALAKVIATGSHEQHVKLTVCSIPTNNVQKIYIVISISPRSLHNNVSFSHAHMSWPWIDMIHPFHWNKLIILLITQHA